MTSQPGLIVLLGSGETSATVRTVYNWLQYFDVGMLEQEFARRPIEFGEAFA